MGRYQGLVPGDFVEGRGDERSTVAVWFPRANGGCSTSQRYSPTAAEMNAFIARLNSSSDHATEPLEFTIDCNPGDYSAVKVDVKIYFDRLFGGTEPFERSFSFEGN